MVLIVVTEGTGNCVCLCGGKGGGGVAVSGEMDVTRMLVSIIFSRFSQRRRQVITLVESLASRLKTSIYLATVVSCDHLDLIPPLLS